MKDDVDVVMRGHLIEERPVHDVARVARRGEGTRRVGERRQVDSHDVVAAMLREGLEQRAPDLAIGPRHENRSPGHRILPSRLAQTRPNRLPTFAKARRASSIIPGVCAAESCTRMRDCPAGTTGYEKPTT